MKLKWLWMKNSSIVEMVWLSLTLMMMLPDNFINVPAVTCTTDKVAVTMYVTPQSTANVLDEGKRNKENGLNKKNS